jgi:hypothetical protein
VVGGSRGNPPPDGAHARPGPEGRPPAGDRAATTLDRAFHGNHLPPYPPFRPLPRRPPYFFAHPQPAEGLPQPTHTPFSIALPHTLHGSHPHSWHMGSSLIVLWEYADKKAIAVPAEGSGPPARNGSDFEGGIPGKGREEGVRRESVPRDSRKLHVELPNFEIRGDGGSRAGTGRPQAPPLRREDARSGPSREGGGQCRPRPAPFSSAASSRRTAPPRRRGPPS